MSPETVADLLSRLGSETSPTLYWTKLTPEAELAELSETDGILERGYDSQLTEWVIYYPAWSEHLFAFLLDGHVLSCVGPEDTAKAGTAIEKCLDTLHSSGEFTQQVTQLEEIEQISLSSEELDLDVDIDVSVAQDSLSVSVDVDSDLGTRYHVIRALSSLSADSAEIYQDPTGDRVPVSFGTHGASFLDVPGTDGTAKIKDTTGVYMRSPNGKCTIFHTIGGKVTFAASETVYASQLTRTLRAACLSDTGTVILGGDLSPPDSQDAEEATHEIGVEFQPDVPNDDLCVYAITGECRHETTVSEQVLDLDITSDGTLAAVLTGDYERSTVRVFDVDSWTERLRHETRDLHMSELGERKEHVQITSATDGYRIYLAETEADDPTYAIDLSGIVVWITDKRVLRDDVEGLISKIESPETVVSELDGQYESPRDIVATLCDITRRHPRAVEPYAGRLIELLEQEAFPDNETQNDANSGVLLLFNHLGSLGEALDPQLPCLCTLAQAGRSETVRQAAAACIGTMISNSSTGVREVLSHFDPPFTDPPVPSYILEVLEPELGELLVEDPLRIEALAETIQQSRLSHDQTELFRTLKQTISADHPAEIKAPLIDPTIGVYIDQINEYSDGLDENGHSDTRGAFDGPVNTVLQRIIDARPGSFATLVEPLLTHCLAAADSSRHRTPGDPSSLLQIGCVLAPQTMREELTAHRTTVDSVVAETDEPAIVDMLLCLGDDRAHDRLRDIANQSEDHNPDADRWHRVCKRANRAVELIEADDSISPPVADILYAAPKNDKIRTNLNVIEDQRNRSRVQRLYEHLQTHETATRGDFESAIASEQDDILNDFDDWWPHIRNALLRLPDVTRSGHTYRYKPDST